MLLNKKVLFLTLNVFSSVGGIEKMNRIIGKALYDSGLKLKIFSSHDKQKINSKYFPADLFSVFKSNKINFTLKSIAEGINSDIVILSHINLLSIGSLIKILSPKTKLVMYAHGIEVWGPLSVVKRKMLKICDKIFAVSNYTKQKLIQQGYINDGKSVVLNNSLDPYLVSCDDTQLNDLRSRYKLKYNNIILLTITRLNSEEKYKGYDIILNTLPVLLNKYPDLKYLIIGKYDAEEKLRMDGIIKEMNLTDKVIFGGFVPDNELAAHYNLANLYIMPSKGEGFGIVFIEAMYYGLPVIAGNTDGSSDALLNGQLGTLVNPANEAEIISAIKKIINDPDSYKPDHKLLMKTFSYEAYKANLQQELKKLYN